MTFTHLHVHTVYSLLDGYSPIPRLLDEVQALGMDAIAITDHGNMHGVVQFYREAKKRDIRPILGCELYTSFGRMEDKDPKDLGPYHIVLLAENETGYRNLMKLVSEAWMRGFYYRPRVDRELLRQYSEGLIATSACLGGEVQSLLLAGRYDDAKATAEEYNALFGQGNFFLELQDHGMREQKLVNRLLIQMSEETGIPLIAANDVHYVKRDDASVHDALLCIQTGKRLSDADRMRFPGDHFYLKSPEEMAQLFPDVPEALENTTRIAERCRVELDFGTLHLPGFAAPPPYTNAEYLRTLVADGLKSRYGTVTPSMEERADFELSTIESMGYVDYFLIVWDFIRYANTQNIIVGPGRGSGAGSIVSYALGITKIDPLKYDLLFERFLNPERITMPDFDIDFCYERREEVIRYVTEKYGEDHVAQIVTFGTMAARGAIRDVGRVLDIPYPQVDRVAKMVPAELSITLDRALEKSAELRQTYETDDEMHEMIDIARRIEGLPRHTSTHAAGVVITKDPITHYVPLCLNSGAAATQFTMTEIEELGLLKMDFLGLRTLTVIQDAAKMAEENHGVTIDVDAIPIDDPNVLQHFHDADTIGIFQFESRGMRSFLRELKATRFEDLIAANSLFRPGPMEQIPQYILNKHQPERIQYAHEKLRPILETTYGIIVYQEQVMQIVREIAGFSLGDADLLRRAMGKKKMDVMAKERERFLYGEEDAEGRVRIPGAVRNGVPVEAANHIYDLMITFANYAFNKSHSAAYALVAMQTAWLKHHYPVEFMAALLSSVIGQNAQIALYLQETKRMGIRLLSPDVNASYAKFTVEDGAVRFGLLAVKGVGLGVIDAIVNERAKGKFISFHDCLDRVLRAHPHALPKKAVENLIWAGAFDSLHANRAELIAIFEAEMDGIQVRMRENLAGQVSFFGEEMETAVRIPPKEEFARTLKLAREKEVLGLYLSDHPLVDYEQAIERRATFSTLDWPEEEEERLRLDAKPVVFCGMVAGRSDMMTKKNEPMTFLTVEDLYGAAEAIVFPRLFRQARDIIDEDAVICVHGRLQVTERDEHPKLIAERIEPLRAENTRASQAMNGNGNGAGTLFLRLPSRNDARTEEALRLLRANPGDAAVGLYYEKENERIREPRLRVAAEQENLRAALQAVLGEDCVVWMRK